MYAMDEIKLSYAEVLSSSACIPGPRDNRVRDKARIIKKTRPKWISDLKHEKYLQEQELGEDKNTWPEKEAGKRNKKIKRTEEETKEGPDQENQENPAQEEATNEDKYKGRN